MRFLLLDGPIKSGHDKSEFVGWPDFCSSYILTTGPSATGLSLPARFPSRRLLDDDIDAIADAACSRLEQAPGGGRPHNVALFLGFGGI